MLNFSSNYEASVSEIFAMLSFEKSIKNQMTLSTKIILLQTK